MPIDEGKCEHVRKARRREGAQFNRLVLIWFLICPVSENPSAVKVLIAFCRYWKSSNDALCMYVVSIKDNLNELYFLFRYYYKSISARHLGIFNMDCHLS